MLFVPFGPFAYWTRAEPFLIFISALALLVATRLRPMAAGPIVGVLAGLASGFKDSRMHLCRAYGDYDTCAR